jgi:hypothetical protein
MTRTRSTYLVALTVLLSPVMANADLIILNLDNGYLWELEPGVLIEQLFFESGGPFITGTNLEFSIDGLDWFGGIGGGQSSFRPVPVVTNMMELSMRTAGGNFYSGFMTYFSTTTSGPFGTHPGTGNIVGAAIELRAVPEPGTLAMIGIGLLGMGAARRRRKA